MHQAYLTEICKTLDLGSPIAAPKRVIGGLSHTMSKIATTKGTYAIKQLSQNIDLKNVSIRKNYELTESIAHRFFEKGIPAIFALGKEWQRLIVINGAGFLVYPWIESQTIQPSEQLSMEIASLLAKIHLIDLQVPELLEPVFDTHTNDGILELVKKAEISAAPFAQRLFDYRVEILKVNEAYQASIPILKQHVVVSHGDLDQKNILWDQDQIILIDWESARKLNPTYEIINASLDWSGITTGTFDKELFIKMMHGYCNEGGKINLDHLHAAFHGALGNWVNWMLYNVKRSCTTQEPELKALSIEQVNIVLSTITRLLAFHVDIYNSPSMITTPK